MVFSTLCLIPTRRYFKFYLFSPTLFTTTWRSAYILDRLCSPVIDCLRPSFSWTMKRFGGNGERSEHVQYWNWQIIWFFRAVQFILPLFFVIPVSPVVNGIFGTVFRAYYLFSDDKQMLRLTTDELSTAVGSSKRKRLLPMRKPIWGQLPDD